MFCRLEGTHIVQITNTTYQVRAISETATGGVTYAAPTTAVPGCLVPLPPAAVYQQWGLELRDPFVLYTDSPDASAIRPGDRIVSEGETYVVRSIQVRDLPDPASHTKLLLDRLDLL